MEKRSHTTRPFDWLVSAAAVLLAAAVLPACVWVPSAAAQATVSPNNVTRPAQDWMATGLARASTDQAAWGAQGDATAQVVQHDQGIAPSLDEKETQQADPVRNVKASEDNYLL
jgi:hypothetical protein